MKRIVLLMGLTVLALLPGAAGAGTTDRASVSSAGVQANAASDSPAISADGRFVAFQSSASNLHADAPGGGAVFVRDRIAGTTELISRADGVGGAAGNSNSQSPAISADGRFVAFESFASNLDPGDADFTDDIFVRDRLTNDTILISRADGAGGVKGNAPGIGAAISGDGRFVAFHSSATNLDPADADFTDDIFVRDRLINDTILISRADGAGGVKGNAPGGGAAISGDGRFVAFQSSATNLDPADADGTIDMYVRDIVTNDTSLISRADGAAGAKGNGASIMAAISAEGRFVAFASEASNLDAADPDVTRDIFVRDRLTNDTTLITRADGAAGAKGNAISQSPAVSADARFVAFHSQANNLDAADIDATRDVFVRGLGTNETILVSRASSGIKGNADSVAADISAGAIVAFQSLANNLVSGDTNGVGDIFVFTDFDRDGMPNDYELANSCLNLEATDSASDPDGDGLSNAAEFGVGTDPCDGDSDNDASSDSVDACPLAAEDLDGYQDADGCPDPDNDGDGVCDSPQVSISCTGADSGKMCFDAAGTLSCPTQDCRNIAEDYDAFKDADGCPEPDNDNDGFPDVTDDCPGTTSLAGADGMLGSPQDLNHNGISDGGESALSTDDVVLTFEDYDAVLNGDGCHDSPGQDFDADGYTDDREEGSVLCNGLNSDGFDDGIADDGCPGGPALAGSFSEANFRIGTRAFDPCGQNAWPSDLVSTGISTNDVDIIDLASFVSGLKKLNKNPNEAGFDSRWDLTPGTTVGKFINTSDLAALVGGGTGFPPMLGGAKAFGGPPCPLAP